MTFEGEIFPSFKAARQHILGEGDIFQYYNPTTGRPIKKLKDYKSVVLYSHNDHLGYKGMLLFKKVPDGVVVAKELFDQSGDSTFNELWEVLQMR